MNKFYEEFKDRLIKNNQLDKFFQCSSYFETYLKRVSEEEMYNILNYDKRTFNNYVNFVSTLCSQKKLNCNVAVVHELTKIIFNTKNANGKLLEKLILDTDIIYNKNILNFAREFMMLSYNDANTIRDAVLEIDNDSSLMKLVTYINYLRNDTQSRCMERLFKIPGIFKHPDFYKFIELIIDNSNAKYLNYIPAALYNVSLFENRNCYQLVSTFLDVNYDYQAKLLFKILRNRDMLQSRALNSTIAYLLDNKNEKSSKYLDYMVDLKYCVSDYRFSLLIDFYKKAGKNEYKINGLTGLFATKRFLTYENNNSNEYLDDYLFELMADYILKTNAEFQVAAIINIVKNIKKEDLHNSRVLLFLEKIIKCKKAHQARLIADLLKTVTGNEFLYSNFFNPSTDNKNYYNDKLGNILNLILNIKDKKACDNFMLLVSSPCVMNNKDYINIIKKYIVLNDSIKYDYYCDMILKTGLLDSNNYIAFDCLKLANKLQARLIHKVIMETDIYLNNDDYELVKYLIASKDKRVLYYTVSIIFSRRLLGIEKAKECIENAIKDPKFIYNQNNNKHVMNVYNGICNENMTFTDKVAKVFKKHL